MIVTAGGTQEALDPVRFIGNRSSGRMGLAIARAARQTGSLQTLKQDAATKALAGITTLEEAASAVMV